MNAATPIAATPIPLDGQFLLINKPLGWTSFDAVNYIRRGLRRTYPSLKNYKVGHAGTLDPFATGLLIIGLGRAATKQLAAFQALPKTYIATIRLGSRSTTGDPTGSITPANNPTPPSPERVAATLASFVGDSQQIPPMYSAKQVAGQRLYTLARAGHTIARAPSPIHIYSLEQLVYGWPDLAIRVTCSAGTYIRTLAQDIGEKLGIGAYCLTLARSAIGPHSLAGASAPETLDFARLPVL